MIITILYKINTLILKHYFIYTTTDNMYMKSSNKYPILTVTETDNMIKTPIINKFFDKQVNWNSSLHYYTMFTLLNNELNYNQQSPQINILEIGGRGIMKFANLINANVTTVDKGIRETNDLSENNVICDYLTLSNYEDILGDNMFDITASNMVLEQGSNIDIKTTQELNSTSELVEYASIAGLLSICSNVMKKGGLSIHIYLIDKLMETFINNEQQFLKSINFKIKTKIVSEIWQLKGIIFEKI